MYKYTFWLIRKSNTWKRIKFKAFLNKLNMETFDAVMLDFDQPYVANGSVLGMVEKANYNSVENCVDFECLLPVAAGTMEPYHFFWPAALLDGQPANEVADGCARRRRNRHRGHGQPAGGRHYDDPGRQCNLCGRAERRLPGGTFQIGATRRQRTWASQLSPWWTRRPTTSTFRPAPVRD